MMIAVTYCTPITTIILLVTVVAFTVQAGSHNGGQFTRDDEIQMFYSKVNTLSVVDLLHGCGRDMNRLLVLSDGTRVCCKYSENKLQKQAELYYHHLSTILGINSSAIVVPAALLTTLNFSGNRWKSVADKARIAGWRNGHEVLITEFIENLQEDVFLPSSLASWMQDKPPQQRKRNCSSSYCMDVSNQWSEMILLDYLTGHTDRLYCTLLNSQWAPSVIHRPVHNLGARTQRHYGDSHTQLVLYDNESAFTIGYHTTTSSNRNKALQQYFIQHVCHFSLNIIETLYKHQQLEVNLLQETVRQLHSHHFNNYPSQIIVNEFTKRVLFILKQFKKCNNHQQINS